MKPTFMQSYTLTHTGPGVGTDVVQLTNKVLWPLAGTLVTAGPKGQGFWPCSKLQVLSMGRPSLHPSCHSDMRRHTHALSHTHMHAGQT